MVSTTWKRGDEMMVEWSQKMDPNKWDVDLSQAALEDTIAVIHKMCNKDDWYIATTPTRLHIHPCNYKMAIKILRGKVHHTQTKRWKYLVKRGARK